MCGFCGIVSAQRGFVPDANLINKMRDRLAHRGPDDAGSFIGEHVGLGHRRLSIVDVSHGQQPMHSEDKRLTVAYNGEIYNHPQIMAQFESVGIPYVTRSDTESVLRLFERDGDGAIDQLRGMFALAIWDAAAKRLLLARDRYGIKPLYYAHRPDGRLIFASEIKALLPALGEKPSLNMRALPDFLANHAPSGEETLFTGVNRLAPGHTLVWQDGEIVINQFWDLQYADAIDSPKPGSVAERDIVQEYRERFTDAVRVRLMSDVPLGAFLSGGIDSASITAVMAKLVDEPINTYTVAFAESGANELPYARMCAERFNTRHREVLVTPEMFFAQLPQLIWHEDEPPAHPASVPLYFVSKLAAEDVKVVLSGEGSDESLAGYNRYRVTDYNAKLGARYEAIVPEFARNSLRKMLDSMPKTMRARQIASRTFLMRGSSLDELYFDNFAVFDRQDLVDLLSPAVREQTKAINPYAAYHQALAQVADKPLVSQLLYVDAKTYLVELLMKQDQMTMAASLESRVPFLDHHLNEWVAGLPQDFRLRGTTTKWILREAMKDDLPEQVLNRPKMGLPVPVGEWLRGPWRRLLNEFVCSARAKERGLFRSDTIDHLIAEHEAGIDHSERLWALLTFEMWARMFLDGQSPAEISLQCMDKFAQAA